MLSNGDPGANAYAIHPYGAGLHPDIRYIDVNDPANVDVINDSAFTRQVLLGYGYGYAKPIWITEVGVDADYNDDNDVSTNEEEGHQANDLYYTWWNSIRAYCSSYNIPLAVFWTFKDQKPYNDPSNPPYYAGFAKVVGQQSS